jgi:hypothetical protein
LILESLEISLVVELFPVAGVALVVRVPLLVVFSAVLGVEVPLVNLLVTVAINKRGKVCMDRVRGIIIRSSFLMHGRAL